MILTPTHDKGGQNPPDGIGQRPPAPKGSGGEGFIFTASPTMAALGGTMTLADVPIAGEATICPICHRRHVTAEDRERGIRAGNITSYNVCKAEEAYWHWEHEQAMKRTPPEYAI